ncbi:sideroflexin-1-3 [Phlebotomus papatasi]|uniref:sideroflexin-1-3 n=1 Tax=Phlebotomus papatasi TaxID=29031 RepID=UPI0024836010|nr:sideroflexin-1-3 [Phlebotomus papatasi]XP_055698424.1 sideroflexin-1-3 [Phlebotomus papatasi]
MSSLPRVNLDEPRYDQSTYLNRAKHFIILTNPLNVFVSSSELDRAAKIVQDYKAEKPVEAKSISEIWRAKYIYDSAFHPETGEKMIIIGRMSAQVPMNMLITGCMMTFYRSTPAVVFWQWLNQSFNALVNYTNRSGSSPISNNQLFTSYCLATGGALATALSLNRLCKTAPPLVGRLVPLAAVAAANCINIPMMRMQELQQGVELYDENNNRVGVSVNAAQKGITAVVLSRISMAMPGMVFTPMLATFLEKKGVFRRFPWANAPIQTLFCGFCLTFATPLCCALYSQKASIRVDQLEKEVQENVKKISPESQVVYFNKGL